LACYSGQPLFPGHELSEGGSNRDAKTIGDIVGRALSFKYYFF
jgi:hypothetical protein